MYLARMTLFEPGLVYPSDDVGVYVDLDGVVIGVDGPSSLDDEGIIGLTVSTARGHFRGFAHCWRGTRALTGGRATIRVYDAGGGFYPDNRVVSLSVPETPAAERVLPLTNAEFRALHRLFTTRCWSREDRSKTRAIEAKLRLMMGDPSD